MRRPVTWLDVFTATPLTGNQLAVVHDADGLDDATMLAFARETRLSETTYVQSATRAGADYRNRIWTMMARSRSAGTPRWAPRWPSRARAGTPTRPTSSRRRPATSPSR